MSDQFDTENALVMILLFWAGYLPSPNVIKSPYKAKSTLSQFKNGKLS